MYDLGRQLGSGHFATVHLAVEKKSGQEYAVKIFRKRRSDDKARTSGLQQEIAVLMSVSHPNVLCLQGTYDEEDGVYLVLELAAEGELFNYIINRSKLTEDEARRIFVQLFNGLKYLVSHTLSQRILEAFVFCRSLAVAANTCTCSTSGISSTGTSSPKIFFCLTKISP